MCDLVLCPGVLFGLLNPETPALLIVDLFYDPLYCVYVLRPRLALLLRTTVLTMVGLPPTPCLLARLRLIAERF